MAERNDRTIRATVEHLTDPAVVSAQVASLIAAGHDGWAQYASGNVAWVRGATHSTGSGPVGFVLAGEWRTGPGSAVHLRQQGDGWSLTRLDDVEGAGTLRATSLLTNLPPTLRAPRAIYQVAWVPGAELDGVRPLAPRFARFDGWKE